MVIIHNLNANKQTKNCVVCNLGNKFIKKLFLFQVCSSDTNAFNLDQGFLANTNAPYGTLGAGTTIAVTSALIGTYCTTNNNGPAGLANNEDSYTGDYITIAGESFFKNSY